ncbi:endonuclease domain-containing protein [Pseudobacillus wudalianchiensis]|uniref:DUF559 domain-containing protein n=1 Tax=Pseudobacillus wudalianchiensis TaxID=1743143 RepID=A0A1B9AN35_9BACI|nr:DUF559 domain-containing protein [Bacillus wudalianchiensis]OCA85252.1 hypothetical protein A8F95_11300 [Bacillus wudalianchiensis]
MKELEQLEPKELIMALVRRGYFLKSAGTGVFIRSSINNKIDDEIKHLVKKRTPDLLRYLNTDYPNEVLESILNLLSEVESLAPNTQHIILNEIEAELTILVTEAKSCDSPLEFELYLYLKTSIEHFNRVHSTPFWVHTQYPITANGHTYRADMLICPAGSENDTSRIQLIVECDGHDFHEKTKAQAQRDKKRDRDLQIAGYRIIRFSGSEIFKDPYGCAKEVTDFLETLIR